MLQLHSLALSFGGIHFNSSIKNLARYAMGMANKSEEDEEEEMRQGIASSRQGTLSREIMADEMKMRQLRPEARWGFPEKQWDYLQNRRLRSKKNGI